MSSPAKTSPKKDTPIRNARDKFADLWLEFGISNLPAPDPSTESKCSASPCNGRLAS